jgi:SAM-dependent methyltransferase
MREKLPPMVRSALSHVARLARRMGGVDEHKRTFNHYYETDAWDGGSGPGSTPEATSQYREFLREFLKDRDISSVVDLGCGDWQFSQLIDWTRIDYTGLDVSSAVLKNTKRFAKPGIKFAELNGITKDVPAADLLILKDVIQHWTNEDVLRFIPQLSKFKYALITNVSHKGSPLTNSESVIGGFRPVDLTAAPFSVPGEYVFEFFAGEPKITFLWSATPLNQ